MRLVITRNDQSVYVIDRESIAQHLSFDTPDELKRWADKHYTRLDEDTWLNTGWIDVARFVIDDGTWDYAMPLGTPHYGEPGYVWYYAPGDYFGRARNVYGEFLAIVKNRVHAMREWNRVKDEITIEE